MDKKALRHEMAQKKKAMTPQEIACCSDALARKLFAHPLYQQAKSLYCYLSYNQEVRTAPILEQAIREGKRVAVPKVLDGGSRMAFLWLDDLQAVAPGYYNIPEPIADGPEADDPAALVIMPGLAFDRTGNRMGYGGGFYDRFLAEHPGHPTVALCYDFQLVDHLETEAHDIPVDAVLWSGEAAPETGFPSLSPTPAVREEQLRRWFALWLTKEEDDLSTLFTPDAVYTESWGPEYHGAATIRHWLREWCTRGEVLQWDLLTFFHRGDQTAAQWLFHSRMHDGSETHFEGMSLVTWDPSGRMAALKEFGCNLERYDPYAQGPEPRFRRETAAWF